MTEIIRKYKVLNGLNDEFVEKIKQIFVFSLKYTDSKNVLIVMVGGDVLVKGPNSLGELGLGHNNIVNELTRLEEFCDERIVNIFSGADHMVALTQSGRVYCWGANNCGQMGNGTRDSNFDYKYKSEKIHFIDNIKIISIGTGADHILALSESGEIYSWGYGTGERIGNERVGDEKRQLIPYKIEKFAVEKVIMVSCGFAHSLALTENGHVYAWGYNEFGQLGTGNLEDTWMPKKIFFESSGIGETLIEYICGGFHHSLALSRENDVYIFGTLDFYQERRGKLYEVNSQPFKIDSTEKFVAIASHIQLSVAAAISMQGFCYIWGNFCGNIVRKPRFTNFVSFNDLFRHYFNITFNLMDISEELKLNNTEGTRIIKPNSSNIGKYSDQFEEVGRIGFGSFGKVFKVKYKLDEQFYAIKIIEMGGISDEQKEKFLREIRVMAKLQSDHIIQYKTSWIENKDILYIQMQLCLNNLSEIIEQKKNEFKRKQFEAMTPLEYYISSELFKEILESVQYLHKQNIIHRDLKPENILITDGLSGRFVKLCDFGLAVIHESETQKHTTDRGTPKYTAPEVVYGRSYDTKADIYSLGAVAQQVFDVDIYESSNVTINNSLLENKYKTIIRAINNMMSNMKTLRPTCDQLLIDKNSWSLEISDIENEVICRELMEITINELSIEENFCKYFIKTKIQ